MNLRQRKSEVLHLLLSMAWLITVLNSCMVDSTLQSEKEEQNGSEKKISFRMNLANDSSLKYKDNEFSTVTAYHFYNGVLQKINRDLTITNNSFSLYAVSGYTIYFLVNLPETEELKVLQTGVSTLSTFLTLCSVATKDENLTQFYSGSYQLPDEIADSSVINLSLYHNVARLDLDTSRDEEINVTRIVITNASVNSMLFPSEQLSTPSTQRATYDKVYNPGIGSTEGIQYLYESNEPVKVTVYAHLHGMPKTVELLIPQLKRNFRYSIKLEGVGSNITGQLQTVPWESGDNAMTSPDETGKIYLSNAYSTLIDGVEIDGQQESVSISEKGGEFILAFTCDIAVSTDQLEGEGGNITITPDRVESAEGKVISFFRINIKPQGKGRLPYQATLHMKRAMQQFSYDRFTMNVSGSSYQIMEATLGGVTWMAFNATTPKLEDQTYPLDGASVEETYRLNWGNTIGGLFQWGRIYKYTPWLSGSNNAGGQSQNNPWTSLTHVPCPSGYRIPTKAEMRALLPPNATLPGTYTYNGETIKAELHTSQPSNVNIGGVTGTARYLSLTSQTTGAVLYFPLSGEKGDKSSTNNPGFGQGFTIWTTANNGAIGGWAWTGRYWPRNNNTYTIDSDSQLQAEGFAYVRCLKN